MLNLLACELFGREMEIDASKVDWHRVLAEANRHVLTAFLYPGLRRLNGVPEEILSRTRNAAMLSAARMEESLRAQDGVLELMRSRGFPAPCSRALAPPAATRTRNCACRGISIYWCSRHI